MMFLGGTMTALTVPLAGVCLTMADFNSQMLYDIAPALGTDMSGDEGIIMADMIDQCVAESGVNLNANMMDIVFQRDPITNDKVYVRDTLVSTVQAPLDIAFGALDDAVSNSGVSISDQSEVQDLRAILRNQDIDAFIIPDTDKVSSDATLAPMLDESALQIALATTTRCAAFTSSDGTLMGVENFVDVLEAYGTKTDVPGTCVDLVTCDGTAPAACAAGNLFIGLKGDLLDTNNDIFRCDIFEDADGNDCDPINMVEVADGQWQNDCLITEDSVKTTKTKVKNCNLAEFISYVQGFDTRIEKVLARLDSETAAVMDGIKVDMKSVIDTHILDPIIGIADGITCGFLPVFYQDVVYNMCYQGVVGLRGIGKSYVLLAFVMIVLALVMFVEFRRARDNVDADRAREKGEDAGGHVEEATGAEI